MSFTFELTELCLASVKLTVAMIGQISILRKIYFFKYIVAFGVFEMVNVILDDSNHCVLCGWWHFSVLYLFCILCVLHIFMFYGHNDQIYMTCYFGCSVTLVLSLANIQEKHQRHFSSSLVVSNSQNCNFLSRIAWRMSRVCQSKIYFRGTQYDIKNIMFIVLYSVLIRWNIDFVSSQQMMWDH